MSEVFEVDPGRPEAAGPAIGAAKEAIARGELVIFPTETVYGVAARPDDPVATGRIFEAKSRPTGLSLPVLAASADEAFSLTRPNSAAAALAERFWPGPLTIVLERSDRSHGWRLGERESSIAVRVPDHPISLALLEGTGPLAATSANISGRPPLLDQRGLMEAFAPSVAVYLLLPAGVLPPGQVASTVVDLTGPEPTGGVALVREGPVSREALAGALEGLPVRLTG